MKRAVQKLLSLSLLHSHSADNWQTIISLSHSDWVPDNNLRLDLRFSFTFIFVLSKGFEIGFMIAIQFHIHIQIQFG